MLVLYIVIAISVRIGEKIDFCGHHNRLRAGTVSIYLFLYIIRSFTEETVFPFICSELLFVDEASISVNITRTVGLFLIRANT